MRLAHCPVLYRRHRFLRGRLQQIQRLGKIWSKKPSTGGGAVTTGITTIIDDTTATVTIGTIIGVRSITGIFAIAGSAIRAGGHDTVTGNAAGSGGAVTKRAGFIRLAEIVGAAVGDRPAAAPVLLCVIARNVGFRVLTGVYTICYRMGSFGA